MSKLEKYLLLVQILLYGAITVFSYSYVDLNLSLTQNPQAIKIINSLQYLGYYQRPLSTSLYILLLTLAFTIFVINLIIFKKNRASLKYLKISTLISTLILIFSYPFLSSDIFNYMFDAKIITLYHQNPYTNRALDFPNDDWIRFMRWVHRYSPYGPLWLILSLVPTLLGFGKFLITLFAFKVFIGSFHLINSILIYKILLKENVKNILFKTALYALNPLFLIEGIVNSHNDVIVATFILLSIYTASKSKKLLTLLNMSLGALTKYITFLNLPWFIYYFYFDKKKKFI